MSFEQPPQENSQEKEPVSYEKVLDAFKALHAAGIKDLDETYDPDTDTYSDTTVQSAFNTIDAWRLESGLMGHRDINDTEKAKNTVKSIMLIIEAGYADPESIKDAIQELGGEHDYEVRRRDVMSKGVDGVSAEEIAQKLEITNQVIEILKTGTESLEAKLEQLNPKEKPKEKVEAAIEEIVRKSMSGERKDVIDAVRQIANTFSKTNTDFNRYFKTAEGKKYFDILKQMEPIADKIYKDTVAKKDEVTTKILSLSYEQMSDFLKLIKG